MKRHLRPLHLLLVAAVAFVLVTPAWAAEFAIARIYIEYNSSANDLGFHVFLDGEDWRTLRIVAPTGTTNFEVAAKEGYKDLGLTELLRD